MNVDELEALGEAISFLFWAGFGSGCVVGLLLASVFWFWYVVQDDVKRESDRAVRR